MSTLPCSAKTRYPTQFSAEHTADLYFRQHGWKSRAYACPFSERKRHWHLTTLTMPEYLKPLHDAALRRVAEQQAREIERQEREHIHRRLREIDKEITKEMESVIARAFMDYIDRWEQRKTLEELGWKI